MSNRRERRAFASANKEEMRQLELLKGITTKDPNQLEWHIRDFESRGLKFAAQGLRYAINKQRERASKER